MTVTAAAPLRAQTSSVELLRDGPATILTAPAVDFVADLVRLARPERDRLLAARASEQARYDAGALPDFEAWLRGQGCVPLYNLMEDAATAEICRTQIWQWIRHCAVLDDGTPVTAALLQQVLTEEVHHLSDLLGPERFERSLFGEAASLFSDLCTSTTLTEFLTLPAYERLH